MGPIDRQLSVDLATTKADVADGEKLDLTGLTSKEELSEEAQKYKDAIDRMSNN